DEASDTISFANGATGIPENLSIDMGGQDSSSGDRADFSGSPSGIIAVADAGDEVRVRNLSDGSSKSWWVSGAEWIVGSAQADEIHLD
ncbi:hypothetical protein ABTU79_20080, partial [Acinetobacter baumannii]